MNAQKLLAGQSVRFAFVALLLTTGALANAAETDQADQAASRNDPKRILILSPDDVFRPMIHSFLVNFRSALTQASTNRFQFFIESLDFNRSLAADEEFYSEHYLRKYAERQPDLIVTISTPPLEFMVKHRQKLFREVPILFFSADPNWLAVHPIPSGVTGIPSHFDLAGTLQLALEIQPEAREVVVIVGQSAYDQSWEKAAREAFIPSEKRLRIRYVNHLSVPNLLLELKQISKGTILFYLPVTRDAAGTQWVAQEVLRQVAASASAPIYSCFETGIGLGAVGGKVSGAEVSGEEMARLAARILNGETIAESIQPMPTARFTVDWRQLKRWGLDEARLPAGTMVRFRPTSIWMQYKWHILGALAVVAAQGMVIIILVINRRRLSRAQRDLSASKDEMTLAAESAQLGMWAWDVSGDLIWATDKLLEIFGFSREHNLSSRALMAMVHPDDRAEIHHALNAAIQQGTNFDKQFQIVLSDNSVRWIAARGQGERGANGKPVRMLGVAMDITARKQAEKELNRHRTELAHVSRLSVMGELSASMAHELNQPLTAILANAQAAQRFMAAGQTDLAEFLDISKDIVSDTNRARDVIRHLRALVRKGEVEYSRLDVGEVIEQVVTFLHGDIVSRNVMVRLELAPDLPAGRGDRTQVQQVLLNLLINAFDAMAENAPADRRVTVISSFKAPGLIQVETRDAGTGLPSDHAEKLFHSFYTTKVKGLGIGLSVSRSIIESHGGKLWAENNPDRGAKFSFTLPAILPENGERYVEAKESVRPTVSI